MTKLLKNSVRLLCFIAASMFLQGSVSLADAGCDLNLTPVLSDAELASSFQIFLKKDVKKLQGVQTPNWYDFNELEQLTLLVERYFQRAKDAQSVLKIHQELTDLEKHLLSVESLRPLFNRTFIELSSDYKPTEYELKILFRNRIEKLVSYFPKNIQFRLPPIPKNKIKTEELTFYGEVMVSKQRGLIDQMMKTKANRSLDDELIRLEEVAQSLPVGDENRLIYESLNDATQTDFAMRRPMNGRFWVPKVGFQNQRVTCSSRGCLSTESRNVQEAFSTASELKNYSEQNVDLMPKYGFLYHKNEKLNFGRAACTQYGEDIYIFKKNMVNKRVTFTPGDSLGRQNESCWSHRFIPAELLPLAAKFFGDHNRIGMNSKFFDNFLDCQPSYGYIEMQFFGALKLDHVEKFIFEKEPPQGEFLEELKRYAIQILDGRKTAEAPVPWVEGSL